MQKNSYKFDQTDLLGSGVCHCINCQKQAGSAFSINLIMQLSSFTVSGDLSTYEDKGEESQEPVYRRFCGNCGSPIFSEIVAAAGLIAVKAGTLDDTSVFQPSSQIWCDSQQNWVELLEGLPKFSRNPPAP